MVPYDVARKVTDNLVSVDISKLERDTRRNIHFLNTCTEMLYEFLKGFRRSNLYVVKGGLK